MKNYNTALSSEAFDAVERIRTLRALTDKTGFATHQEQFKVLMALNNADCLTVAEVLAADKRVGGAK